MTLYRSRAPLRVSFAGGGTDLPQYFYEYGGQVISTTINKYVHISVEFNDSDDIQVNAYDLNKKITFPIGDYSYNGDFDIIKAILKKFDVRQGCKIYIYGDMPAGSGMGTSSSMTVALISLFANYKNQPMTKYEIAELACFIERKELSQAGGYQDQYAASFGGFNYIKFFQKTLIYSLKLSSELLEELNHRLILCYTGKTHISAEIQKEVLLNYDKIDYQEGMNLLKLLTDDLRDILVKDDKKNLNEFGRTLHLAWVAKKQISNKITNQEIEKLYMYSLQNGANGGKLLGAGGGGFLLLFVEPLKRMELILKLQKIGGEIVDFRFENTGVISWRVN